MLLIWGEDARLEHQLIVSTGEIVEKAVVPPEKNSTRRLARICARKLSRGTIPLAHVCRLSVILLRTYGVSRTIVREALLMLELQGTVDIRQGSGVYVMRIPEEHENEEERFLNSDVGPFEILQARQLLESNIAAFAARMATRADIDNLRRIIEQEQRAIAANDNSRQQQDVSSGAGRCHAKPDAAGYRRKCLASHGQQPAVAAVQRISPAALTV